MFTNFTKNPKTGFSRFTVTMQTGRERDQYNSAFPNPLPAGHAIGYRWSPDARELIVEVYSTVEQSDPEVQSDNPAPDDPEWAEEVARLVKLPFVELSTQAFEVGVRLDPRAPASENVAKLIEGRKQKALKSE